MPKIVALQTDPTSDGMIMSVPSTMPTLNGLPIATGGSKLIYKGSPGDAPLEFATGVMLNNQPLTFVGAKTVAGAVITGKGATTAYIENSYVSMPGAPKAKAEDRPTTEVLLKSTYAMEQVQELAKDLAFPAFYELMCNFFGKDIPRISYEQLYKAMSKKEELNPPIVVYRGNSNEAFWHNTHQHIGVYEGLIKKAAGIDATKEEAQEASARLLAELLEEYGHYLDHLLRNKYSSKGGDAEGDEGAVLSYFLSNYRITEEKKIDFATATINGSKHKLKLNLKKLLKEVQKAIKRAEQDYKDAEKEYFSAGKKNAEMQQYGHFDIENELKIAGYVDDIQLSWLYLGNYMRDMSQVMTPSTMYYTNDEIGKLTEFDPGMVGLNFMNVLKPSRKTWTLIVEILAAHHTLSQTRPDGDKELKDVTKDMGEPPKSTEEKVKDLATKWGLTAAQMSLDYVVFLNNYIPIDEKNLGVYRPEEHIDNPIFAAVHDDTGTDEPQRASGKYICKEDALPPIHPTLGMKTNIRNCDASGKELPKDYTAQKPPDATQVKGEGYYDGGMLPTAAEYMRQEFVAGVNKYYNNTDFKQKMDGLRHIGQGLHVLEDFFAHSNFAELMLIKVGISVYPWVDVHCNELKDFNGPEKRFRLENPQGPSGTGKKERHTDVKEKYNSEQELETSLSATGNYKKIPEFWLDGFYFMYEPKNGIKKEKLMYIANKKSDGFYVNLAGHEGLQWGGHSYAAQIPLVTGYFSPLDTLHSLTHAANDLLKKQKSTIKLSTILMSNNGTGTPLDPLIDLQDMLIIAILQDLRLSQFEKNKTDDTFTGKAIATVLDVYVELIKWRKIILGILEHIKKGKLYASFVTYVVSRFVNTAYALAHNAVITIVTETLDSMNHIIGHWQTLQITRMIGTNPSHTQLAKDEETHPLHPLAALLAIHGVKAVGEHIGNMLKSKKRVTGEDLYETALGFMVHPVYSDWADQVVIDWIEGNIGKMEDLVKEEKKRQAIIKSQQKLEDFIKEGKEAMSKFTDTVERNIEELRKQYEKAKAQLQEIINMLENATEEMQKKIEQYYNNLINYFGAYSSDPQSWYNGFSSDSLINKQKVRTLVDLSEKMDGELEKIKAVLEKEKEDGELTGLDESIKQYQSEHDLEKHYRTLLDDPDSSYHKLYNYLVYDTSFRDYKEDGKRMEASLQFLAAQKRVEREYLAISSKRKLASLDEQNSGYT